MQFERSRISSAFSCSYSLHYRNLRVLPRKHHLFPAIETSDIYKSRCSDAHSAAWANILSAAGRLRARWSGPAVCSRSRDGDPAILIPIDQNIRQAVFHNEFKELFRWGSVRPSVFFAVFYVQAVKLGGRLKVLVVIGVASAAILDSVFIVPIMAHLMQQRGAHIKNVSAERSRSDIDFMRAAKLGDPSIFAEGEMTIRARRALYRDRWP